MRIVEELKLCPEPTETEGFSGFSFNKGMDLLSGCTGMGAEAWVCKARSVAGGMFLSFDSIWIGLEPDPPKSYLALPKHWVFGS